MELKHSMKGHPRDPFFKDNLIPNQKFTYIRAYKDRRD